MKAIALAAWRALWRFRLAQAHRYRAGAERVMQAGVDQALYAVDLARAEQAVEIAKAQADVDYCREQLAKAERAAIEARADRKLSKVTA